MALDIDTVFRDHVIKGDIHSGANDPDKADIRSLLRSMFGGASNPSIVKQKVVALDLVTPASEAYGGMVLNDPDPTKNGYYYRDTNAWVKGRGLPDTFAEITLSGTGSAQAGLAGPGVNPGDVLVYFAAVETDNTGPLKLTIGGVERDVVNLAGNALSAGEWTGVVLFYLNGDGDYQLVIDAGAVAAAAQSATDAAQSAQDAADAAAGAGVTDGDKGDVIVSGAGTTWTVPGLSDPWLLQPLGVPVPIFADLFDTVAAALPPTDQGYRYILLTAGVTGSGEYNEGILITESVSGSYPLVVATAEIAYPTSPFDGKTVHLLNTEGRYLIAGATAGVVRMDQLQQITGTIGTTGSGGLWGSISGVSGAFDAVADGTANQPASGSGASRTINFDSANSPGARAGAETHGKDIAVLYVLRII